MASHPGFGIHFGIHFGISPLAAPNQHPLFGVLRIDRLSLLNKSVPESHRHTQTPLLSFLNLALKKQDKRVSTSLYWGKEAPHTHCPGQGRVSRSQGSRRNRNSGEGNDSAQGCHKPRTIASPGCQDKPLDAQDTSDRQGHWGLCKKKKHQVIIAPPWLQLPVCLSPLLHWRSEAKIALTGLKWLPASQTIWAKLAWKSLYHAVTNLIFPVVKTACLVPYPLSHITPIPVSQTCHIQPTLCVFGHQATRQACSLCSPRCVTSSLAFRAQIKSYF